MHLDCEQYCTQISIETQLISARYRSIAIAIRNVKQGKKSKFQYFRCNKLKRFKIFKSIGYVCNMHHTVHTSSLIFFSFFFFPSKWWIIDLKIHLWIETVSIHWRVFFYVSQSLLHKSCIRKFQKKSIEERKKKKTHTKYNISIRNI